MRIFYIFNNQKIPKLDPIVVLICVPLPIGEFRLCALPLLWIAYVYALFFCLSYD